MINIEWKGLQCNWGPVTKFRKGILTTTICFRWVFGSPTYQAVQRCPCKTGSQHRHGKLTTYKLSKFKWYWNMKHAIICIYIYLHIIHVHTHHLYHSNWNIQIFIALILFQFLHTVNTNGVGRLHLKSILQRRENTHNLWIETHTYHWLLTCTCSMFLRAFVPFHFFGIPTT